MPHTVESRWTVTNLRFSARLLFQVVPMARKLPADFNADWYRAAYPDVALSGLDPREHYLRFGRRLNRQPNGKALSDARAPAPTAAKPLEPKKTPEAIKPATPPKALPMASAPADRFPAIVARPKDFNPEDSRPTPAPPRRGMGSSGILSLDSLFEEGVWAPLLAYAGMMRLSLPDGEVDAGKARSSFFLSGETRIENAWHTAGKLRLAIAGATDVQSAGQRWILRAYQADPASPGDLLSAGEGLQFPAQGPIFHDVELRHPLMPLLLELSDSEGVTHGFRLVAFPSLLPGGLHAAELRALQAEADPMDSFWLLSDALLQEFLNRQNTPDRSFVVLNVDDGRLSSDVQEWLAAIGLASDGTSENDTRPRLTLPKNSLPTLSALFSRRPDLTQPAPTIGNYLVADAETLRPLWSVSLPPTNGAAECPPAPLAISMRHRAEVSQSSVSLPPDFACPALTVFLRASDADRTEAIVVALGKAAGDAELEFIVRLPADDAAVSQVLDKICGSGAWKPLPAGSPLLDVAREARHEVLLTVDDRVRFDGPNTVAALCKILCEDETVASASCVLIGERVVKKHAVLQPTIGGLFPAGWSFAAGPHLTFTEPDVLEALSGLTFPVVANSFHLTVWRTALLAGLAESDAPVSERVADLRIGLDLLLAGHTNLCTTQVQAGLTGQIVRRDLIDPFGAAGVSPHRAGDVLNRVTLLRDLT